MKTQKRINLRVLLLFAVASVLVWHFYATIALAQSAPPQLPPTARDALGWLSTLLLSTLPGLLANRITERVKTVFNFLKEKDQQLLAKTLTDLTAAIISIGCGWLLAHLASVAGWLDVSGVWRVIVFAWPWAWTFFQIDKRA